MSEANSCAYVDDISEQRQTSAAHFANIRVRTRWVGPVRAAVVVFREAAAGGRGIRTVPARLRDAALRSRIFPRAGQFPRPACPRVLDGTVAQPADGLERCRTSGLGLSQKS